jgi:hypothetical protein
MPTGGRKLVNGKWQLVIGEWQSVTGKFVIGMGSQGETGLPGMFEHL